MIKQEGKNRGPWGIDYFIFPREFFNNLPPFALGRAYYDNWLIWKALNLKGSVVDATDRITAIHQNHDYSHVSGGWHEAYRGKEVIENVRIGGGLSRRYCIYDATHFLTPLGLKRNLIRNFHWETLKIKKKRLPYLIKDLTRPLRHTIGIRNNKSLLFKSFFNRNQGG